MPDRPKRGAAIGFAVIVLTVAAAAILNGGGGIGACAAPPPGPRSVNYWPVVQTLWPAAVAFFVLVYLALGVRSRLVRVFALVAALGLTWCVAFVCLFFEPYSC